MIGVRWKEHQVRWDVVLGVTVYMVDNLI
jgi:hypothetical protein